MKKSTKRNITLTLVFVMLVSVFVGVFSKSSKKENLLKIPEVKARGGVLPITNEDGDRFKLSVNEEDVELTKDLGYPDLVKGRTMVPIRLVSEELGFKVGWEDKDRRVTITDKDRKVELIVGESFGFVNGEKTILDDAETGLKSYFKEKRTMVPLRFISESLGAEVEWDMVDGVNVIEIYMKEEGKAPEKPKEEVEKPVKKPVSDVEFPEPEFKAFIYGTSPTIPVVLKLYNPEEFRAKDATFSAKLKAPWDKYGTLTMANAFTGEPMEINEIENFANRKINHQQSIFEVFDVVLPKGGLDTNGDPVVRPKKGDVMTVEVKIEIDGAVKIYDVPCEIIDVHQSVGGKLTVRERRYPVKGIERK